MYMPVSGPGLTFIIAKRHVAGPDGFAGARPDELSWVKAKRRALSSPHVSGHGHAEPGSPPKGAPEVVLVVGEEVQEGAGSAKGLTPCQMGAQGHQAASFPAATD